MTHVEEATDLDLFAASSTLASPLASTRLIHLDARATLLMTRSPRFLDTFLSMTTSMASSTVPINSYHLALACFEGRLFARPFAAASVASISAGGACECRSLSSAAASFAALAHVSV